MIDVARLREISGKTTTAQVFGCLQSMRPPRVSANRHLEFFPPIERPAQQFADWWRLHDNSREAAMEPLVDNMLRATPYGTKYALGYVQRPYLIASLGIKWGYSLMAFAQGARAAGVPDATVNGYDEEVDRSGSIEWARQAFIHDRVPYNLGHSSAKDYVEHGIPLSHIDLFYISGDRTNIDFPRDINLTAKTLSPRGIIVVDESGISESVLNQWALENSRDCQLLDGLYILSAH